ncbi:Integrase family protein [uncultured Desulfobacterium sp.]|uniref:Integrase family protein n=1 Tax=uncultured Desulfobacterium sp. TaxID=201089 RepID=A0A445MXF4_9BACT|nr:Integrase family protein [uncultured Desulfobacterium sp.]
MSKKGGNVNHPKAGASVKVEPIKSLKDIQTIKKLLADKPRDLALFTLGININLRASDLIRLTVGQVRGLKSGDAFELKEQKTGKVRRITLNGAVIEVMTGLLASECYEDKDALFKSQRGVLTVPSVHRLVKSWCRAVNLKGNYGSHTLRKTWGYHQRVTFGTGLPELMECFGHATQRQTLAYLCIQPEEIKGVYLNEL